MRDKLIAKRDMYLKLKAEIEGFDYMTKIEEEVAVYKAALVKDALADKNAKVAKVDTYLELLDELITDAETEMEKPSDEADDFLEPEQLGAENNVAENIEEEV